MSGEAAILSAMDLVDVNADRAITKARAALQRTERIERPKSIERATDCVLIIEDDQHLSGAMREAARLGGLASCSVDTAAKALDILADPSRHVERAIVDWHLRDGTAVAIVAALRQREIPSCVFTGDPFDPQLEALGVKVIGKYGMDGVSEIRKFISGEKK